MRRHRRGKHGFKLGGMTGAFVGAALVIYGLFSGKMGSSAGPRLGPLPPDSTVWGPPSDVTTPDAGSYYYGPGNGAEVYGTASTQQQSVQPGGLNLSPIVPDTSVFATAPVVPVQNVVVYPITAMDPSGNRIIVNVQVAGGQSVSDAFAQQYPGYTLLQGQAPPTFGAEGNVAYQQSRINPQTGNTYAYDQDHPQG